MRPNWSSVSCRCPRRWQARKAWARRCARILATAKEMGYQSPAAKAAKTQEGEGKIIGIVVADLFFDENTFYSNLYRALLRAGINRKSVMLTVGYPPLPFCLDAGSRQKLHRAGSRLYAAPALYCTP